MKTFGITRLCSYPKCKAPARLVYFQRRFGRRRYRVKLVRCLRHPLLHMKLTARI